MSKFSMESFHPRLTVQEETIARCWSTARLAKESGLEWEEAHNLMNGLNKEPITERLAEGLSRAFGVSKEFFLNLQSIYDKEIL